MSASGDIWTADSNEYFSSSIFQIPQYYSEIAAQYISEHAGSKPIKFLDVAAGPGTLTSSVLRHIHDTSVIESITLTDFSSGMCEVADQQLSAFPQWKSIKKEVLPMDGQAMTFEDSIFTHIGCMFGILFYSDHLKGMQEIFRVLEPGGQAVIATWKEAGNVALVAEFVATLNLPHYKEDFEAVHEVVGIDSDPAMFQEELTSVGFREVVVTPHERDFSLPNTIDTYLGFINNPCISKVMNGQDTVSLFPKWQEFLTSEAGKHWLDKDGRLVLTFTANIAIATK